MDGACTAPPTVASRLCRLPLGKRTGTGTSAQAQAQGRGGVVLAAACVGKAARVLLTVAGK